MYIRELNLKDFRSWAECTVELEPGITIFAGRNGFGKTNIIEAIGYTAHLGSHRVSSDSPLVRQGKKAARVSVTAVNQGRELSAHLLIKAQGANQAQINRTKLKTPRELLGVVKTVLFSPEDLALVRGEPEQRRKFLDHILVSRFPRLAGVRADYEKILRQRNSLLKTASSQLRRGYHGGESASEALRTLDTWDSQLARVGSELVTARLQLTYELNPLLHDAYARIAPESRPAAISYKPTFELGELDPNLLRTAPHEAQAIVEALLLGKMGTMRQREIERGTSLVGPHRDDLEILLGDYPAKGFASHGETWSMALSLRLAEYNLLRSDGTDPVLILDDVFAELDAQRREKLVAITSDAEQVLITAAVDEDLPESLNGAAIFRHTVSVTDTPEGRVSILDSQDKSE